MSNDSQKIGIVLTSYNQEDFIERAVESVLNQRCLPGWEFRVVIVDDGSTDLGPDRVIKRFELQKVGSLWRNGRLTMLQQKNGERGRARNVGAHHLIVGECCEWLFFLDGDDYLNPNCLKGLTETMQSAENLKHKAVGFYGYPKEVSVLSPKRIFNEGKIFPRVISQTLLTIGSSIVSSKTFLEIGGFREERELSGSEDWVFFSELARRGQILFSPTWCCHYERHSGNTKPQKMVESMEYASKIILGLIPDVSNAERSKMEKSLHRYVAYGQAGTLMSAGHYGAALKRWLSSKLYLFTH